MAKKKGQNYMHGAAILTVGVVIMKILGAIYKIPIGNIIGDDGYSMFLASYNIYFVFFTLATSGFPIALSRMISEADAEGRPMQARRTFKVALRTFLVMGAVFALVMFIFPKQLAENVLHNPEAAYSIFAMAPAILLVCVLSAYRGYIQGFGNMIPTTVGQVLEVLAKVVVGLLLAYVMIKAGKGKPMGSAGAIFGVTIGSGLALLYMALYKKKHYPDEEIEDPDTPDSSGKIFSRFVRIGIPIALGSSVMSLLNLLDSSLCMGRLQSAAGFSLNEAQVLYGIYGKAQTFFNLPAAFITPLTISVVPAIAAAIVREEDDNATAISEDSMRVASAISMPMGVGLAVMSEPIMQIMYPGSHESGPLLLAIMGVASFFVCIVLMENAVLQASGKERCPMYSMITGSLVKIAVNWFLVANPKINIYGAPIGTLAGYLVMAVMNFVFMCYVLDKNPRLRVILLKPFLCSAIMGGIAFAAYRLCGHYLGAADNLHLLLNMLIAVIIAVLIYAVLVIVLRVITKEDMKLIPGGEKIARVLHMK